MYGPPNYISANGRETEALGVIPRAIHHIFELSRNSDIIDFQLHCSFVQIYNENLFDMLRYRLHFHNIIFWTDIVLLFFMKRWDDAFTTQYSRR